MPSRPLTASRALPPAEAAPFGLGEPPANVAANAVASRSAPRTFAVADADVHYVASTYHIKHCVTYDGDDPNAPAAASGLVLVAIVARRLKTAPSILLVIAGIGLALFPASADRAGAGTGAARHPATADLFCRFAMSWREFRFNLRPITLLAFGCVVFTTCAVAAVAHWLLGCPCLAFVLGAIVAPPDVVAPLAIARRLGLPRRLLVVLEGEGLANDATALILYRFAVLRSRPACFL